jgi:hypothetical protein
VKPLTTVTLAVLVPLVLTPGGPASADQQHIVSPAELAAAVADRHAAQDADRAAVREALARPEVRRLAASMGVDVDRVSSAAETLSGPDLEQAAAAARQVNQQLLGGATTVTISTTTIIIVLLVIILLIVALK